ncbi:H(+)/Cl(-) exchange transporter ClcA [Planctomycetes bacterium Pan216]|uniref:H(+)/Cl(-) exchange transporter ClcA n=1 Tax=Kolteria novifilia TaxID=2527975 RepID=A0A518AX53_9BACT|nr:H(+)/Cl(-) exchange transporter ClcA [Planctomycetes bacterium Pan216]
MPIQNEPLLSSGPKPLGHFTLGVLAFVVGVLSGFGAVAFRALVDLSHNLFFLGTCSFTPLMDQPPQSVWGIGIILAPVVGAVIVSFIVTSFAPEARGSGVPQVMKAIYYHEGRIRPLVAIFKALASSITIGSGGSAGREGPIMQIGASLGSALGQVPSMTASQRISLIAAGAAGGIAATFNAPIAGVCFAVELLLPSITATTLLPVAISTTIATLIGRYYFGLHPTFYIPALEGAPTVYTGPYQLAVYLMFGLALGLLCSVFVRSIYWVTRKTEGISGNYYLRHCSAMLLVGIVLYLVHLWQGRFYVQGVGYAAIEDVLRGGLTSPWLLLVLVVVKLVVTALTLGSGASGGIFSPCIFLGAMSGGALGFFLQALFPDAGFQPTIFAMAGIAGMVGGATGALLTSIIIVFEMTQNLDFVQPAILTVAAAYTVRKTFSYENVYTHGMKQQGTPLAEGLESGFVLSFRARDFMTDEFFLAPIDSLVTTWPPNKRLAIIIDNGLVRGVLHYAPTLVENCKDLSFASLDGEHSVSVDADASVAEVQQRMASGSARIALVTKRKRNRSSDVIIGVVDDQQLMSLRGRVAQLQ